MYKHFNSFHHDGMFKMFRWLKLKIIYQFWLRETDNNWYNFCNDVIELQRRYVMRLLCSAKTYKSHVRSLDREVLVRW